MTRNIFSEGTFDHALLGDLVAFDIETFSPEGFPYNFEDPVVNYSMVIPFENHGLLFISVIGTPKHESGLLRLLYSVFNGLQGFNLLTYNGSRFDVEYILKRGRLYGLDFTRVLGGLHHIDVYRIIKWLGIRLPSYAQKCVEKYFGIRRVIKDVTGGDYHVFYRNFLDEGELTPVFYNIEDSFGCFRIAKSIPFIMADAHDKLR